MSAPPSTEAPCSITDHQARGALALVWADGTQHRLSYRALRKACRCASCQKARLQGLPAAEPEPGLRLLALVPVGTQGLNLQFSDGHGRGIYPWAYLRTLGDAGAPSVIGTA